MLSTTPLRTAKPDPPTLRACRFRALAAVFLLPAGVAAQTLPLGPVPREVTVVMDERPYVVRGDTPGQLLAGLRAEGRGSRWYSYRWRLQWRYESEPVEAPSLRGSRATTCQTKELSITLTFTPVFPVWERPDDPDPELVEAWEGFSEQIRARWLAHRDVAVGASHEIVDRADRLRMACPLIFREAQRMAEDVLEEFRELDRQVPGNTEVPRWPPPGLEVDEVPPVGLPGAVRSEAPPALDFYGAVQRDVGRRTPGLVLGIQHQGQRTFLDAFGTPLAGSEIVISPGTVFAFPALTEILLAQTVSALGRERRVNPSGPLSALLPDLSPGLGAVTLTQLLDHRAGLDNANLPDSTAWGPALEALDDRALFTDPGSVFSYSRYSYPLVAMALERGLGQPLEDLVTTAVLDPLGMDSTTLDPEAAVVLGLVADMEWPEPRDWPLPGQDSSSVHTMAGLPVAYTTLPDVLTLLAGSMEDEWAAGRLSGLEGSRRFRGGVWMDRAGELPRVTRLCASAGFGAGFYVFPETRSALAFWAVRGWPATTEQVTLRVLGEDLGLGPEILAREVAGTAILTADIPVRCRNPEPRAVDLGPEPRPVSTGAWDGRYENGDRLVILEDRDGVLAYDDGGRLLDVVHYTEDIFFPVIAGQPLFPIRLLEDSLGRRYVMLGDRAYLHTDDRGR